MATLRKGNGGSVYSILQSMTCGDGFKNGPTHIFRGTSIQAKLLAFIMRSLEIKVERLSSTSFKFTAPNLKIQLMMFKLCRYVRNEGMTDILRVMRRMIRKGVAPHNAIMLAHYSYTVQPQYYASSMDILAPHRIRMGFKTRVDWINRAVTANSINSYYMINSTLLAADTKILRDLIMSSKFKEAELMIIPK